VEHEVVVQLTEDGADPERIETLSRYLRSELLELSFADVRRVPAGPPPEGSRAFDAGAVGQLMVILGESAVGLKELVTAVRSWLARGGGTQRSVRLQLDGDVLELSQASIGDQNRLVDLFVSKHERAAKR
jgi:hypothetical protein